MHAMEELLDMVDEPQVQGPTLVPVGIHAGQPAVPLYRMTTIGSHESMHLRLVSPQISRAHAVVLNCDGGVFLHDLNSRDGVYVNDARITEVELRHGDVVRVGRFCFRLEMNNGPHHHRIRRKPRPVQLEGPDGQVISLDRRVLVIGQRRGCDLRLRDAMVATVHAILLRANGRHYIRDLGSHNGTQVNGRRIRHTKLRPGDEIRIANGVLRYVRLDAPNPLLPEPAGVSVSLTDQFPENSVLAAAGPAAPADELDADDIGSPGELEMELPLVEDWTHREGEAPAEPPTEEDDPAEPSQWEGEAPAEPYAREGEAGEAPAEPELEDLPALSSAIEAPEHREGEPEAALSSTLAEDDAAAPLDSVATLGDWAAEPVVDGVAFATDAWPAVAGPLPEAELALPPCVEAEVSEGQAHVMELPGLAAVAIATEPAPQPPVDTEPLTLVSPMPVEAFPPTLDAAWASTPALPAPELGVLDPFALPESSAGGEVVELPDLAQVELIPSPAPSPALPVVDEFAMPPTMEAVSLSEPVEAIASWPAVPDVLEGPELILSDSSMPWDAGDDQTVTELPELAHVEAAAPPEPPAAAPETELAMPLVMEILPEAEDVAAWPTVPTLLAEPELVVPDAPASWAAAEQVEVIELPELAQVAIIANLEPPSIPKPLPQQEPAPAEPAPQPAGESPPPAEAVQALNLEIAPAPAPAMEAGPVMAAPAASIPAPPPAEAPLLASRPRNAAPATTDELPQVSRLIATAFAGGKFSAQTSRQRTPAAEAEPSPAPHRRWMLPALLGLGGVLLLALAVVAWLLYGQL